MEWHDDLSWIASPTDAGGFGLQFTKCFALRSLIIEFG